MNGGQNNDQSVDIRKEYLTFTLGDKQYGVDILKVQEIRGWETLRELHDVPDYIRGVLDFRGVIIPIVDLRMRFGAEKVEYLSTTVIIVLSVESGEVSDSSMMGIVVDSVSDVLSVKPGDLKKAPDLGSKIKTDYVLGMVSSEQGMIMLVDSDRLVDKEELEVPGL